MAFVVVPNEAYDVTSSRAQMTVCTTEERFGESMYQTNVAYGITTPAIGTGTFAEYSLKYNGEYDSQDVDVDVTPNEAYGITPAGVQMSGQV